MTVLIPSVSYNVCRITLVLLVLLISMVNASIASVVTFFVGQRATNWVFANQSFTLPPNSIKLTIEIFDWPFLSIANTLQITLALNSNEEVGNQCFHWECNHQLITRLNRAGQLRMKTQTKAV